MSEHGISHPSGITPGELPGDSTAGLAAYLSAGIGVVSTAALGAMYAVEVPRGGPYRFGAVNDFTGGLFFATTIPAIIQVHRRLPRSRASRIGLASVVTASGAASASGILLALKLIPFVPSTVVTMAGIISQAAWVALTQHLLLRHPGYPTGLARTGRGIGVTMVAALPVVAAGYAAQSAPGLQKVLYGVGGGVGAVAYIGWPLWLFALGRNLRQESD
ncbi:hypothetical protein GA0111570_105294 [Raineyella antarctica]|uniref:Integral membrane protein n=1 Tax=Raineyella antarctica TaxID=1577474 RepID=A0A1G6GYX3_9ACTN|nr:hypothetical protein [Raineyella antarctica]SDB87098.1 hypothetical protein GA0111570_105294 [Raineyella antarctica]